jgi:GNAT superfamily N-acetyltransferase
VTRPAPLTLTLGAVTSFLPANPVLYLAVGGDLDGLRNLRDAVFAPPLARKLSWPWVPHVTLADGAPEDRIASALEAMKDYTAIARIDRVVLLEEGPGRLWTPLADAALGPPARIGTGGLTVELVRGRLVDPRFEAPEASAPPMLAVNAYRERLPVGWARATVDREGTHVEVFVQEEHRGQGIGRHLRAHIHWALDQQP